MKKFPIPSTWGPKQKYNFLFLTGTLALAIAATFWFLGPAKDRVSLSQNSRIPSIRKAQSLHHKSNRRPASTIYQIVDAKNSDIEITPHTDSNEVVPELFSTFYETYQSLEMTTDDFFLFYNKQENGIQTPFLHSVDAWATYLTPDENTPLGEVELLTRITVDSGTVDPTKLYEIKLKGGESSYVYVGTFLNPTSGEEKNYTLRFTNIDQNSAFGFIDSFNEILVSGQYAKNFRSIKNFLISEAHAGPPPMGLSPYVVDEIDKLGEDVQASFKLAGEIGSGCLKGVWSGFWDGGAVGLWDSIKKASEDAWKYQIHIYPVRAAAMLAKKVLKDGVKKTIYDYQLATSEVISATKFFMVHGARFIRALINDQIASYIEDWNTKSKEQKAALVCSWVGQILFDVILEKCASRFLVKECKPEYEKAVDRSEEGIEIIANNSTATHGFPGGIPNPTGKIPGTFVLSAEGVKDLNRIMTGLADDFMEAYQLAYDLVQRVTSVAMTGKKPVLVFPGRSLPLVSAILQEEFALDVITVPASKTRAYMPRVSGSPIVTDSSTPYMTLAMQVGGGFEVVSSVFNRFVGNRLSGSNIVPIIVDYSTPSGGHGIYGFTAALEDWLEISKKCKKPHVELIHAWKGSEFGNRSVEIGTKRGPSAPETTFSVIAHSYKPGPNFESRLRSEGYNSLSPVSEFDWSEVSLHPKKAQSTADALRTIESANYKRLRKAVARALGRNE